MTEADSAAIAPIDLTAAENPRPRRRAWVHLLRLVVLLIAAPVVFAAIAGAMMIGQEITAPSWVKARVEAQASAVLEGGRLSFGTITVTVGTDLHPRVRMTDTELQDAMGLTIARVPMIEALVSPRGLVLRQEILPQEITLTGAQIALRRAPDGTVAVAFAGANAGANAREERAGTLAELLEQFDQVFERPALEALEQIRAGGLIVNFEDARAGGNWTVDDASLAIDLRGGTTSLRGQAAVLSGRSYVTALTLTYDSPRGSRAARMAVTIQDAAAADIAAQSPALAWLALLDAPLSAALRFETNEDGTLGPFSAALKVGAGSLRPDNGAPPVEFDAARAYLSFDPALGAVRFDQIAVQSDWGALQAEGDAYLRDMQGGWPATLLGQFSLTEISLNPRAAYPEPLAFPQAFVDFRLQLNPFLVTIGAFSVADAPGHDTGTLRGHGEVSASPEGWTVALDAQLDQIGLGRFMALWPVSYLPITRAWMAQNLIEGTFFDMAAGLRIVPGARPQLFATHEFRDATALFMRQMPPVTQAAGHVDFSHNGATLMLDRGFVTAPQGGVVDVSGSVFQIPDTRIPNPPANVRLRATSTVTAALSLLDQPPFNLISNADLPVTLADGRISVTGRVDLPLAPALPREMLRYDIQAELRDIRSDVLIEDRVLTASRLDLLATQEGMSIGGRMQLGQVPLQAVWRQRFVPEDAGRSQVAGEIELSQRFVDEFNIGLPRNSVSGSGNGSFTLDILPDAAPRIEMRSDLVGLGLRLSALNWAKPAGSRGMLEVSGTLGDIPRVDRIAVDASGLQAEGNITLTAAGTLERARFGRVRLDGWFDAPVEMIGRGRTQAAEIVIAGGQLDFRRADFGDSGDEGGPMRIALDRLQISDGIALTGFTGAFDASGGFTGNFAAQVNGGAAVRGSVVPQGARSAVRLVSDEAGGVLRSAGFLENANGGSMDLTLMPAGTEGSYDGDLRITGLRVRDAPALASLLSAISVVGLLEQLDGQGLAFEEVRAEFRLSPDRITVTRANAIGASLGISLDGIYTYAGELMDFQGVVSPFYLINGIGAILTRRGEGLIGFNFTLRGSFDAVRVGVNPLSVLTPGMFREIFRRPPPEVNE